MAVKNYGIRDQWTNLDKLNNVDIKSVDGVIESDLMKMTDKYIFRLGYRIEKGESEKYSSVITLHYLEGFSVEEIASMLRITQSGIKMRLSRGREALKKLIETEEE